MKTVKINNKKGFTLVEALIALVILTVGMLAIFEGLVLYMRVNLNNLCRDEAVRIAEEKMNYFRSANATLDSGTELLSRTIHNFSRNFVVRWTSETISSTSTAVKIEVSWNIAGKEYKHSVVSILSRAD